jgi:hypothetical protein
MEAGSNPLSGLAGGMVAAAWIVSPSAAVITLASYLGMPDGGRAVWLGVTAAVVLWVVIGGLIAPFASAREWSNARSWAELAPRRDALQAQLTKLQSRHDIATAEIAREVAREVEHDLRGIDQLGVRDLRWATRRAYIAAWERVHHAEEALIEATRIDELWGEVERNHLRLTGAQGISPSLAVALRDIARYMAGRRGRAKRRRRAWAPRRDVDGLPPVGGDTDAKRRLREVTAAINEFRDFSWAGLVHLRNRLYLTLCLTGLFAYAILALAVTMRVGRWPLISGATFFLLAALVGLVGQLAILKLAPSDRAVDDYGVAFARVLQIPMLAGLAGLGGLLVTAVLSDTSVGTLIQAASASRTGASLPSLPAIFDLDRNRGGIIFAILFGYAPNLFTGRLDSLVTAYKTAISSTDTGTVQS